MKSVNEKWNSKEYLYQLLELISEFNCTYALDEDDEAAVDAAIETIERVFEQEG